jgi:ligand-binding SRPBCC domain-containing protein
MYFESSIIIERPVEVVFAYMCDLSNLPRWDPTKSDIRVTPEGPVRLGTKIQMMTSFKPLSLKVKGTYEITVFEANRQFIMTATAPFPHELIVRVEPVEGGTQLTNGVQAEPSGYYKYVEGVLINRVKRWQAREPHRLKRLLEAAPDS